MTQFYLLAVSSVVLLWVNKLQDDMVKGSDYKAVVKLKLISQQLNNNLFTTDNLSIIIKTESIKIAVKKD